MAAAEGREQQIRPEVVTRIGGAVALDAWELCSGPSVTTSSGGSFRSTNYETDPDFYHCFAFIGRILVHHHAP